MLKGKKFDAFTLRSLLPTASPNLYLAKYKSQLMKYSLCLTKYR